MNTPYEQFLTSIAQLIVGALLVAVGAAIVVWGPSAGATEAGVIIGIGAGMMPGPGTKIVSALTPSGGGAAVPNPPAAQVPPAA